MINLVWFIAALKFASFGTPDTGQSTFVSVLIAVRIDYNKADLDTLFRTNKAMKGYIALLLFTVQGSMPLFADRYDEAATNATQYLEKEALSWQPDNACFSCHNNGDATRVLLEISETTRQFKDSRWNESLEWLDTPEKWKKASPTEVALSPALAIIQFGNAMLAAQQIGLLPVNDSRFRSAAILTIESQHADGYWEIEPPGHLGSPGTYGNPLGTAMALRILKNSKVSKAGTAIQKSMEWITKMSLKSTIDLAAGIQILKNSDTSERLALVAQWRATLIQQQNDNGSWGPYASRFGEAFDTAVALLTLTPFLPSHPDYRRPLELGRSFLANTQEPSGGWTETTRPAGGTSYAQHISTSAWALSALTAVSSTLEAPL